MTSRTIWRSAWLSLAAVLLLVLPARAQSSDWTMESFHSDISIHNDASITVVETIQANFSIDKHGIYRTIPFQYATDNGGTLSVPLHVDSITRDGNAEPYSTSISGNNLTIKIGDANVTITGAHTYVITYTAQAAVNFFSDHDELYWNVTGDAWDVPLGAIEATVRLDSQVSQDQLQARCLTGATGTTGSDCQSTLSDSAATFTASGQPLTIVFGWPTGVVTKPSNYDQLRQQGTKEGGLVGFLESPFMLVLGNVVLPLLFLLWIIMRWRSHGRDPKSKGTIVAQYDPPPGLTPGEMGVLFDERANHRDIVATIVDLAVRGYLEITEKESERFLGLGHKKDYQLTKKKSDVTKLRDHEKHILAGIFDDSDEVMLSELKGSLYRDIQQVKTDLYSQVAQEGYFVKNPNTVRTTWVVIGFVIASLGFTSVAVLQFGPILIGAFCILFATRMPKRTPKGVEALWHARGFKLFLEKAEKYRLQWQEKEHIFEQYLPYAMAFGVAEKWSKTFEGIQQAPPDWYHGSSTLNTLVLWSALNDFSTVSAKSFTPPAASGSSGFGGGGFSGGGFGGGGGGSW